MGNRYDRAHGLHIFPGGFCFSRRLLKSLSECSPSIEISEEDGSVVIGVKATFVGLDDPDRLADEGLAQEDAAASPLDLAVAADPSHVMIGGILRFAEPTGVASRRRLIVCSRRIKTKRLMRPLLVEDATEHVETPLLSPLIGRRRVGGVLLQRSMHSLMTTVLLRVPRFDPLRPHAGLDQLHREPAETAGCRRRKGRTIVRADHFRQPNLAE